RRCARCPPPAASPPTWTWGRSSSPGNPTGPGPRRPAARTRTGGRRADPAPDRGQAAGGDGRDRGHRLVHFVWGVVDVEAQPAAGGRGQPEGVVGERRAVTARPRLHPGPVQGLGHANRVTAR